MVKKVLEKMYVNAANENRKRIFGLLEENEGAILLDLGCDDGEMTKTMGKITGSKALYGVEIVSEKVTTCESKGIVICQEDLNGKLSLESEFFDVIHANQVLEHLHGSDIFLAEIYRCLKEGGYAIISTENGSSWCNIFASMMGWQAFSLTNFSGRKASIGNPFALHRNEESWSNSWRHVRIYNYLGLKEYFENMGFTIEAVAGSGYFPLPSILGNIDKRHSHFITFKIRKPVT